MRSRKQGLHVTEEPRHAHAIATADRCKYLRSNGTDPPFAVVSPPPAPPLPSRPQPQPHRYTRSGAASNAREIVTANARTLYSASVHTLLCRCWIVRCCCRTCNRECRCQSCRPLHQPTAASSRFDTYISTTTRMQESVESRKCRVTKV